MSDDAASPSPVSRVSTRLVGLNFALLLALGVLTILVNARPGGAAAQPPEAAARTRGEYTIVSGRFQGGTSNAVYVLDAANQELMALAWNRSRDEMEIIGHRRIADDAQFRPGR
ncbi:MAG: hypothetical protein ACK4WH_03995 [Phycisphaerales bacterium]